LLSPLPLPRPPLWKTAACPEAELQCRCLNGDEEKSVEEEEDEEEEDEEGVHEGRP